MSIYQRDQSIDYSLFVTALEGGEPRPPGIVPDEAGQLYSGPLEIWDQDTSSFVTSHCRLTSASFEWFSLRSSVLTGRIELTGSEYIEPNAMPDEYKPSGDHVVEASVSISVDVDHLINACRRADPPDPRLPPLTAPSQLHFALSGPSVSRAVVAPPPSSAPYYGVTAAALAPPGPGSVYVRAGSTYAAGDWMLALASVMQERDRNSRSFAFTAALREVDRAVTPVISFFTSDAPAVDPKTTSNQLELPEPPEPSANMSYKTAVVNAVVNAAYAYRSLPGMQSHAVAVLPPAAPQPPPERPPAPPAPPIFETCSISTEELFIRIASSDRLRRFADGRSRLAQAANDVSVNTSDPTTRHTMTSLAHALGGVRPVTGFSATAAPPPPPILPELPLPQAPGPLMQVGAYVRFLSDPVEGLAFVQKSGPVVSNTRNDDDDDDLQLSSAELATPDDGGFLEFAGNSSSESEFFFGDGIDAPVALYPANLSYITPASKMAQAVPRTLETISVEQLFAEIEAQTAGFNIFD